MARAIGSDHPLKNPSLFLRLYAVTRDRIQTRYGWSDQDLRSVSWGRFLSLCGSIDQFEELDSRQLRRALAPIQFLLAVDGKKNPPKFPAWLKSADLDLNTRDYLKKVAGAPKGNPKLPDGTIKRTKHLAAVPDEDEWGELSSQDMDQLLEEELNRSYDETAYPDEDEE